MMEEELQGTDVQAIAKLKPHQFAKEESMASTYVLKQNVVMAF